MQYEVTIKLLVKSRKDEDRVARQLEAVIDFGTVREAIAEGLHLNEDPNLLGIEVAPRNKTSKDN
jgi:hypothetical protein